MIIQKSVNGNSVVVVDREDYLRKMHNDLSDQKKFTIVNLKDDTLLNLAVNQEKHVDKVVKELVESNSRTEKNWYLLKTVGSGSSVMYSLCKVHKVSVENCPPFRPILLALNTPTYKIAKFLVPILKPLATNEFTVKDSFHFAEEIVDQQPAFFMGSLNVDSLLTYPVGIYMFKVNNRNTRTRCEICSKSTIKTPERRHWCCSGILIVDF